MAGPNRSSRRKEYRVTQLLAAPATANAAHSSEEVASDRSRLRVLSSFRYIALFALTLAAWTGVLLRFGMITGMPAWAANYGAVRHAHSHLMNFGWVTLALMALIWRYLPDLTGRPLPRTVAWQMAATAVAALLSFPAFWANGYGLTQVGPARLPLGSMVSTLNGLTWFWFIALYIGATRRLPGRPLPVRLWDGGLALLLLASGGAVGLVGMVLTGADHPFWQQFFLHQFLDLFAVGWFTLALLGVMWARLGSAGAGWLPTYVLALLLAPTFFLGMSPAVLTPGLLWLAILTNVAAAALLAVHLGRLWPRERSLVGCFSLAALALIVFIALSLLLPGLWERSASGALRIFYLHLLLLAWVSTQLLATLLDEGLAASRWLRRTIIALWLIGVTVMVVALFGIGAPGVLPIATLLRRRRSCSLPAFGTNRLRI
jgi:hypothetical protein